MLLYTLKRVNLFVMTLIILSLISYSIERLDVHSIYISLPYFIGWLDYLWALMHLNFGVDNSGAPIGLELIKILPPTLELYFIAFIISVLFGLSFGTLAGIKQGRWIDTWISYLAMICYSAPIFWVALILILIFSLHLQVFPLAARFDVALNVNTISELYAADNFSPDAINKIHVLKSLLANMALPCFVLAIAPTAQMIGIVRNSVADVYSQNYIRVAKIRGLSQSRIIIRHVLKNALYTILPKIGALMSSMVTLTIVVEVIFNRPGIGKWLLNALTVKDYVSIQAGVIVIAAFILTAYILADLFATFANPLRRKNWHAIR